MKRQVTFFSIVIFIAFLGSQEIEACIYPPDAILTKTQSGTTFKNGQIINFSGTASTSGNCNPMASYNWFLDSNANHIHSGSTLDYTFTLPPGVSQQSFDIILRVTNTNSQVDETTITITITKPSRVFFLRDHLGSVRTTVDESGNVLGLDDYYPFGLVMDGHSDNVTNPNDDYKFTGHERDEEAVTHGIDYMKARSYDPVIGRFLQVDPMHEFASPYIYVGNNPLTHIDPTGMFSEDEKEEIKKRKRKEEEKIRRARAMAAADRNWAAKTGLNEYGYGSGTTIQQVSSGGEEGGNSSQIKYNTEYGIFIESAFFESSEDDSYETKEQKRQMTTLLTNFGDEIKKAFGPGGIYENVLVFFHLSHPLTYKRQSSNKNSVALTSWGNRNTSYKDLYPSSYTRTADFGINDLVIDVRINPNKLRTRSGNTAQHEFVHVLLIASAILNNEPVLKGGLYDAKGNDTQHGVINSYNSTTEALRNLFSNL